MRKLTCLIIISLFFLSSIFPAAAYFNNIDISDEFFFKCLYYTEHEPIYIEGDEDFNEENGVTNGNGTLDNPYIIEDWKINCITYDGIVIKNTSFYFIIKSCYIYNGGLNKDGIVFYNVTNGIIEYNIITGNRNGVMFRSQYPGKENSDNNIISNNSIEYNKNDGIHFQHTGLGWHSNNSIFSNYIFSNNRGIYMIMSANNQILYNKIISNDAYGIQLERCMGGGEHNIIYHNTLCDNKGDEGQVCEWGNPLNFWNNSYPSGGNFWNDYKGIDSYHGPNQDIPGSDGIGDTPYDIPEGNNQDNYPLMEPINNRPPEKPKIPSGPTSCRILIIYFWSTSTIDPEGEKIRYGWDWDEDDVVEQWTEYHSSGDSCNTGFIALEYDTLNLRVIAEDIHGTQSEWSDPLTVTYSQDANNPPNEPIITGGEQNGKVGKSYTYTVSAHDIDGDEIYFWFDWGDGNNTGWINSAQAKHTWYEKGTYEIKVKSKDIYNAESNWAILEVSMFKSKAINIQLILNRFFQRFTLFEKITCLVTS